MVGNDAFSAAVAGQSLLDGSVGVSLDIARSLPALAGTLRGSGGLFAIGGIVHGIQTQDYLEVGLVVWT